MPITFNKTIPILRIFDVKKAKEFYCGFLGFKVDWEHRFEPKLPLYMQVSRGDLVLHLSEHHGDGSPGHFVFVWMTGIEKFHREITAKKYRYLRPGIGDQPWGRCVTVYDPFGNHLRFCEKPKTSRRKK